MRLFKIRKALAAHTLAHVGERHNLPDARICANCEAGQYPREMRRLHEQNMQAWELGLPGTLTAPEWLRTLKDWNWSYWCCGEPFEALDHLHPRRPRWRYYTY